MYLVCGGVRDGDEEGIDDSDGLFNMSASTGSSFAVQMARSVDSPMMED